MSAPRTKLKSSKTPVKPALVRERRPADESSRSEGRQERRSVGIGGDIEAFILRRGKMLPVHRLSVNSALTVRKHVALTLLLKIIVVNCTITS